MRKRAIITIPTILLLAAPHLLLPSHAATLFLYPQNIDIHEGQTEIVEVRLDTEGETTNAVEIIGSLDNANATVDSVGTANSFLQFYVEEPSSDGTSFRFVGGLPNGFDGSGIVGIVTIKANNIGQSTLSFNPSSRILAHTENTYEIPLKLKSAAVRILKKGEDFIELASRSHPSQTQWYNNRQLNIHWDLEKGAEYSYVVSRTSSDVPDDTPDRPTGKLVWQGDISVGLDEDGVYYFAVKKVGQNEVSRYRALIDTAPPEWIDINISDGVPETDGNPFISFLAKDILSGIDRYEVSVDNEPAERVSTPYVIPDSFKTISLTAYDKAGNSAGQTIRSEQSHEKFLIGLFVLLLLALLGIAWRYIKPIRRKPHKIQSLL